MLSLSRSRGCGAACAAGRLTGYRLLQLGVTIHFFRYRSNLRRHAETHVEGFSHPCSFCEKEFPQRNLLKAHKLRAHPEHRVIKPFNCDLCDHASISAKAIEAHKMKMHKV